jgi:hypothetical protein
MPPKLRSTTEFSNVQSLQIEHIKVISKAIREAESDNSPAGIHGGAAGPVKY